MATTSDLHVVETRPLVAPALLHQDLAPDASALNTVTSARKRIQAILRGDDQRLLAVVGPCSVHDVQAAREYAERSGSDPRASSGSVGSGDAGVLREAKNNGGLERAD